MTDEDMADDEMQETGQARTDYDLDSIEVGTPSKGKIKMYCNSRKEAGVEIMDRVDNLIAAMKYAKKQMD